MNYKTKCISLTDLLGAYAILEVNIDIPVSNRFLIMGSCDEISETEHLQPFMYGRDP